MEPSATQRAIQTLECMEIWGGNQSTDRAVATPGLDLWVYSRPYEGAVSGGDVHYVSLCGGGKITRLILADVSGHGASVAAVAKSLRTLMRKNINRKDQARLVQSLNREFLELGKLSRFATAVVGTYLTNGNLLTLCNAGHPRPLYYKAATREWIYLTHHGSASSELSDLPLGVLNETGYTQVELSLGRGDLVLLYTDALTEAENHQRQYLGETGLLELVRGLDSDNPSAIPRSLVAALDAFRGGRPADDDLSILLLHHNGRPARSPGVVETLKVYAKVLGLAPI